MVAGLCGRDKKLVGWEGSGKISGGTPSTSSCRGLLWSWESRGYLVHPSSVSGPPMPPSTMLWGTTLWDTYKARIRNPAQSSSPAENSHASCERKLAACLQDCELWLYCYRNMNTLQMLHAVPRGGRAHLSEACELPHKLFLPFPPSPHLPARVGTWQLMACVLFCR